MNKKLVPLVIITAAVLILISGIIFVSVSYARGASSKDTDTIIISTPNPKDTNDQNNDTYISSTMITSTITPAITDIPVTEAPFVPATEMDLEPSSLTVFVNKEYSLPKDYRPKDLVIPNIYFPLSYYDERTLMRPEAALAIEQLFLAAKNAGYNLCGVSGFRSYRRQYKIFTDNILTKGKDHTLKYSAVPGTSEHQTGLAMDISCDSLRNNLSTAFANASEGIWVAENAHRFGYIIRYPEGKGDITGYAYEPWHIRYVGRGLATYLYEKDLTLEEYYKYKPSKKFDFEAQYADLINITPTISGFPIDGEGFVLGENGEIIESEYGDKAKPTEKGNGAANSNKSGDNTEDNQGDQPQIVPTPTMTPEQSSGNEGSATDPGNSSTTGDSTGQIGNEINPTNAGELSTTPTPTGAVSITGDYTDSNLLQ